MIQCQPGTLLCLVLEQSVHNLIFSLADPLPLYLFLLSRTHVTKRSLPGSDTRTMAPASWIGRARSRAPLPAQVVSRTVSYFCINMEQNEQDQ
jgi:hypothetical protein